MSGQPAVKLSVKKEGWYRVSQQDLVAAGFPAFLALWDKTRNAMDVRNVAALNCQPMFLNTNNPRVHALADFTDQIDGFIPTATLIALYVGWREGHIGSNVSRASALRETREPS